MTEKKRIDGLEVEELVTARILGEDNGAGCCSSSSSSSNSEEEEEEEETDD